jgi:hypothetical protein
MKRFLNFPIIGLTVSWTILRLVLTGRGLPITFGSGIVLVIFWLWTGRNIPWKAYAGMAAVLTAAYWYSYDSSAFAAIGGSIMAILVVPSWLTSPLTTAVAGDEGKTVRSKVKPLNWWKVPVRLVVSVWIFAFLFRMINEDFANRYDELWEKGMGMSAHLGDVLGELPWVAGFFILAVLTFPMGFSWRQILIEAFEEMDAKSIPNTPENRLLANAVPVVITCMTVFLLTFEWKWLHNMDRISPYGALAVGVHSSSFVFGVSLLLVLAVLTYYGRGHLRTAQSTIVVSGWLVVNLMLCVSVALKLIYYIDFFGLTYLRISAALVLALSMAVLLIRLYYLYSLRWLYQQVYPLLLGVVLLLAVVNWNAFIVYWNTHFPQRQDADYLHSLNSPSAERWLSNQEKSTKLKIRSRK